MGLRGIPLDLGAIPGKSQLRSEFIGDLLAITGDTRLFWLPNGTDTTTSTDQSLNGRTFTYDATIAAQLSALGLGYAVTFDGSSDLATVPDAANLSFGSGTADSAFSILALANVTNTAAYRYILSKDDASTNREWGLTVNGSDQLEFYVLDNSVGAGSYSSRVTSTAITMGSWALLGATYSAATGGATAGDDMTIYQNGTVKTSSASNSGTYVAMEDKSGSVYLGARGDGGVKMQGSMALVLLCQKNLSASEHWTIKSLINYYFGLSL